MWYILYYTVHIEIPVYIIQCTGISKERNKGLQCLILKFNKDIFKRREKNKGLYTNVIQGFKNIPRDLEMFLEANDKPIILPNILIKE